MKLLRSKKGRRVALAIVTVLGALLLLGAQILATWQSSQVAWYNRGVEALHKGELNEALQDFNNSLNAYQREQNPSWLERYLLPAPSPELAALAYKNEGLIFILAQKPEAAVTAFKQSLAINSGTGYGPEYSSADVARLQEEARVVQYDLELLYKKNPSLQQGEGKGQGKGQGKQGDKPAPGQDPSKGSGKGNRDAI
jgi:tetratricopeptide (TPR) repeat protein